MLMRKESEPESTSSGAAEKPRGREKRPYRPPRLVAYGDLRRIAMVKGGSTGDGKGNPASKV
jgi:hypothetical protein